MSDPSRRTNYKLRRTLSRPEPESGLRRQLWGVPPAEADRLLSEQELEYSRESQRTQLDLANELAEQERLQREIESQRARLQTLRNVVDVLRTKLAKERAAKAVLAARLMDRQLEERAAQHEKSMNQMRSHGIRLGADLQREHNTLRELVAALYRSVTGSPLSQAVAETAAAAQSPSAAETAARQIALSETGERWHQYLVGKMAGATLRGRDGQTIVAEGQILTPEHVTAADQAGLLFDLILPLKMPPSDQDL